MKVPENPDTGSATVDLESRRLPGVEARNGKFGGPSLIPDLDEITARHGYLPEAELVALAARRRRPLYEIQGLISFYPHFRTDPPVKVDLHVCHDLACWMAGYEDRLAALRARYGDDVEVEIREVSCLGRCDRAPAVWVDAHTAEASEARRWWSRRARTRCPSSPTRGPRARGRTIRTRATGATIGSRGPCWTASSMRRP